MLGCLIDNWTFTGIFRAGIQGTWWQWPTVLTYSWFSWSPVQNRYWISAIWNYGIVFVYLTEFIIFHINFIYWNWHWIILHACMQSHGHWRKHMDGDNSIIMSFSHDVQSQGLYNNLFDFFNFDHPYIIK